MKKQRIKNYVSQVTGILLLASAGMALAVEDIGTTSIGKIEFERNCAACHGAGGKGDGPFVEFLKEAPSDLTVLSKNNAGVFPQARVYEYIRDAESVRAHGTKEMPIWGDRYSQEIIERYGEMYSGPGSSVNERILELVFYLGNLQQKP